MNHLELALGYLRTAQISNAAGAQIKIEQALAELLSLDAKLTTVVDAIGTTQRLFSLWYWRSVEPRIISVSFAQIVTGFQPYPSLIRSQALSRLKHP